MFKKILLTVTLCLIATCFLFGQQRFNRQNIELDTLISKDLLLPYWNYDNTLGKWGTTVVKMPMRLGRFRLKDNSYTLLIFEETWTYYKYPTLKEDLQIAHKTIFCVFPESTYRDILTKADKKTNKNTSFWTKGHGDFMQTFTNTPNGEMMELLSANLTEAMKHNGVLDGQYSFMFNSQTLNNADIVRFIFPFNPVNSYKPLKESYYEVSLIDFKNMLAF